MKNLNIFTVLCFFAFACTTTAQEMGNVNYGSNRYTNQNQQMTNTASNSGDYLGFSIRGIYNHKPSGYAATFAIVQVGTTAEEVDALMSAKVDAIKKSIKTIDAEVEVITDMISFVPKYDYEVTKKLFSKKTYNEVPAGFEMKKNLIIKYKKRVLDDIMSACAAQEVYDLVKVDYIINDLEGIRAKLEAKTTAMFNSKLKYYSMLSGIQLQNKHRTISESYNLMYPTESYSSYSAYSRAQLPFEKNRVVNNTEKNTSYYYNPVVPKNHTYVVNPEVIEPCIQIFYDLSVSIKLKDDEKQQIPTPKPLPTPAPKKEIYLITHKGEIKPINL